MSELIVFQHLAREGPGLFEKVAKKKGLKISIYRPDLEENLPKPGLHDLLLILGGPMSVKDLEKPKYCWIQKEIEIIKYATKKKIPVIGVCLGAQIIAYALGGNVEALKQGSSLIEKAEIGWGKIKFIQSSYTKALRAHLSSDLDVLHWHGERIILPEEAVLIASSELCKEQIFSINENAFGFQCHLEVTDKMVYRWIKEDKFFITKTHGEKGSNLITEQQKLFGNASESSRLRAIENLFEILLR